MSSSRNALKGLAAAAFILVAATGCSGGQTYPGTVVTDEERAAYESARFGNRPVPPETGIDPAAEAAAAVTEPLLHPSQWPELAHGKLCQYTATLIGDADRDGTVVPEKARAAANRILAQC